MSENDISKMKVADLKKELKARGLSVMGNKNELVDRLQCALLDGGDVLEDTANSEDLLDDDDLNDDLLDEDKDLTDPVGEEEQILMSPTPSEKSKSKSPEEPLKPLSMVQETHSTDTKSTIASTPPKKIALKRNISITKPVLPVLDSTGSTLASELTEEPKPQRQTINAGSGSDGEPEKKVIKLGQLTALERLEMRAKKFAKTEPTASATTTSTSSAMTSGKDKLQARAARFGLNAESSKSNSSSAGPTGGGTPAASIEALKKRAERFGCSVSSKMTKIEQEEKLAKRQARFAQSASTANGSGRTASVSSKDYAEKARQRLERFKTAA
ncbi:uncharacterized protein LOC118461066 [Anopheles albimanus]|uniref:SAP domain-containing protein n=1 Tax=Anopheles albimanus TaxID=7167 RepID=A0A182FSK3_ANOAL|nr:uncharacterized protein LOC118461066 [Anopheles albimanus]